MILYKPFADLLSDSVWRIVLSDGRYDDKARELLEEIGARNPGVDLYVWLVTEHELRPVTTLHGAGEYDLLDDAMKDFVDSQTDGMEDGKTGAVFYVVRDRHRAMRAVIYIECRRYLRRLVRPAVFARNVGKLLLLLEPQRWIEERRESHISFMELPSFLSFMLGFAGRDEDGVLLRIEPLSETMLLEKDVCQGVQFFASLLKEWEKMLIQMFDTSARFFSGQGCALYVVIRGDVDDIIRKLRECYEANHEMAVPLFEDGEMHKVSWPVAFVCVPTVYANLSGFYFDRTERGEGFYVFGLERRLDREPEELSVKKPEPTEKRENIGDKEDAGTEFVNVYDFIG